MGAEASARGLTCPLRALGPEIDTFATRPMTSLGPLHLDSRQPMPRIGDGCLLAGLPATTIDALCATATPGPLSVGPEAGAGCGRRWFATVIWR